MNFMEQSSKILNTKLKKYSFNDEGVSSLKTSTDKGQNWPVVYILQGEKEAYVGETNNAYKRMTQHLENPKRKTLDNIYFTFKKENPFFLLSDSVTNTGCSC